MNHFTRYLLRFILHKSFVLPSNVLAICHTPPPPRFFLKKALNEDQPFLFKFVSARSFKMEKIKVQLEVPRFQLQSIMEENPV